VAVRCHAAGRAEAPGGVERVLTRQHRKLSGSTFTDHHRRFQQLVQLHLCVPSANVDLRLEGDAPQAQLPV
jgi:hypothetical protein